MKYRKWEKGKKVAFTLDDQPAGKNYNPYWKIQTFRQFLEDFETIRKSGYCNMFDYHCVVLVAKEFELSLSKLDLHQYGELLNNISKLRNLKKGAIKG